MYNNLHIYVSGRVANLLNLENENIENLFIINERVPICLKKHLINMIYIYLLQRLGQLWELLKENLKAKDTDPAVITIDDHV